MTTETRLYFCQHGTARRGYCLPTANCPDLRGGDRCVWTPETDDEKTERQRNAILKGTPAAHLQT